MSIIAYLYHKLPNNATDRVFSLLIIIPVWQPSFSPCVSQLVQLHECKVSLSCLSTWKYIPVWIFISVISMVYYTANFATWIHIALAFFRWIILAELLPCLWQLLLFLVLDLRPIFLLPTGVKHYLLACHVANGYSSGNASLVAAEVMSYYFGETSLDTIVGGGVNSQSMTNAVTD